MDPYTRAYYEEAFKRRFIEARGTAFQDLFSSIMEKRYPGDFQRVRPWGPRGDRKNDGYLKSKRQLFQVYAPDQMKVAETITKIEEDLAGALKYQKRYFDEWVFFHNQWQGLPADVLNRLLALEQDHPPLKIGRWSLEELRQVLLELTDADIASVLGPVPPPYEPPQQVPAAPADFTGREKELADLKAAAARGQGLIICCRGMGGVGKTVLAEKLAQDLAQEFPDGRVLVRLATADQPPLTAAQVLARVIQAFRPTDKLPEEEDSLAALYRSVLEGKRVFLLLDNAVDAGHVRPLVPPPPPCLMVVTTRERFALPGHFPLELTTLPREKSVELLLKIAGRIGGEADRIARLCGDLPLALRAAASLISVTPDLAPAAYARELEDERTRLEKLGQEGVEISVEASFELSYRRLSAEAAAVLQRLAVFPATFDAAAEEAVCRDDGHRHLSALLRMSMVEFNEETGRYNLHDLVRLFARRKLRDPQERHAAERRHAVHYVRVAALADQVYLGKEPDANVTGLRLFDGEWENIKAGQAWSAARRTDDTDAARLCSAYPGAAVYCLLLRLHAKDRIAWLEPALQATRRITDRKAEGVHLGNLGVAHAALGEVRKAIEYYEKHLLIAREIGDRRGEGNALWNMALALRQLKEPAKALDLARQALAIYEAIEDPRAVKVRKAVEQWERQPPGAGDGPRA